MSEPLPAEPGNDDKTSCSDYKHVSSVVNNRGIARFYGTVCMVTGAQVQYGLKLNSTVLVR